MNGMNYISKYLKSFKDFKNNLESLENKGVELSQQQIDLMDKRTNTDISYDEFIKNPNNNLGSYTEAEYNDYRTELLKSIDEQVPGIESAIDKVNDDVLAMIEAKTKEIEKFKQIIQSEINTLGLIKEDLKEDVKNAKSPEEVQRIISSLRDNKSKLDKLAASLNLLDKYKDLLDATKKHYDDNFNEQSLYTFASIEDNSDLINEIETQNEKLSLDVEDDIDYRLHISIEPYQIKDEKTGALIDTDEVVVTLRACGRKAEKRLKLAELNEKMPLLLDKFTKGVASQTTYSSDMIENVPTRLVVKTEELGYIDIEKVGEVVNSKLGIQVDKQETIEETKKDAEEIVEVVNASDIVEPQEDVVSEQVDSEEVVVADAPTTENVEVVNEQGEQVIPTENEKTDADEEQVVEDVVTSDIYKMEIEEIDADNVVFHIPNKENNTIDLITIEKSDLSEYITTLVQNINEDMIEVTIGNVTETIKKETLLDYVLNFGLAEGLDSEESITDSENDEMVKEEEPQKEEDPYAQEIADTCYKVVKARKAESKKNDIIFTLYALAGVGLGVLSNVSSGIVGALAMIGSVGAATGTAVSLASLVKDRLYYQLKKRKIEKELERIAEKFDMDVIYDYEEDNLHFEDENGLVTSAHENANNIQEALDESKVFKNSERGLKEAAKTETEIKLKDFHPVTIDYLNAAFEEVGGIKAAYSKEEGIEENQIEMSQKDIEAAQADITYDRMINGNIEPEIADVVTEEELTSEALEAGQNIQGMETSENDSFEEIVEATDNVVVDNGEVQSEIVDVIPEAAISDVQVEPIDIVNVQDQIIPENSDEQMKQEDQLISETNNMIGNEVKDIIEEIDVVPTEPTNPSVENSAADTLTEPTNGVETASASDSFDYASVNEMLDQVSQGSSEEENEDLQEWLKSFGIIQDTEEVKKR